MKQLFRICLFLLLLIPVAELLAQEEHNLRYAKIKLNNGVSIKGYVVDSVSTKNLVLRTSESGSFLISLDQVKFIRFGGYAHKTNNSTGTISKNLDQNYENQLGFYHLVGLGLTFAEQEGGNISLTTENGYRFNDHFSLGIGVNYDRYARSSALPVYANFRGFLYNKKVTPYYFLGGGYGFAWKNNNIDGPFNFTKVAGGMMAQTGLGYQINFANSALQIHLGYKMQQTRLEYESFNYIQPWDSYFVPNQQNVAYKEKRLYRRIELKAAFVL
ncbi:MAG: hypothetical protein ACNS62_18790 [Candidatus Cyclobacteriaceae bacterium M3_2C_046]